jgi:hypothetical protein
LKALLGCFHAQNSTDIFVQERATMLPGLYLGPLELAGRQNLVNGAGPSSDENDSSGEIFYGN